MKPAIESVLEKAAGLATGLILMALGGGTGVAIAGAGAAASGIALWAMIQRLVSKTGLDSRTTLDAIRRRAFLALESDQVRLDVEEVNAALIDLLPRAIPNSEALVEASFDSTGFPARATALVMDELGRERPSLFGNDAPGAGREFARAVVFSAMRAALETPEYYQKLEPLLNADQSKRLGQIQGTLGRIEGKLDAGLAALQSQLSAITARLPSESEREVLRARIHWLQVEHDATFALIRALLCALLDEDVTDDRLLAEFEKQSSAIISELEEARRPSNSTELVEARKAIQAALDAGDIAGADLAYQGVAALCAARRQMATSEMRSASLEEADTYQGRARLALARLDRLTASDYLGRAAQLVHNIDEDLEFKLLIDAAIQLAEHGELFPGVEDFRRAIKILQNRALPLVSQKTKAESWAGTQNNLGVLYAKLGERSDGSGRLEALELSVVAFRAALTVRTRESAPEDWATTKNNLGNALRTIGERSGGRAGLNALRDAIALFHEALEIRTRDQTPVEWATTQNNLGGALALLGERLGGEPGSRMVEEAAVAFRAALEVVDRGSMLSAWAEIQGNLGSVLRVRGERTRGAAGIEVLYQSVAAYRRAVEVTDRATRPTSWATLHSNFGNALRALGDRLGGSSGLEMQNQAVEAYRVALEIETRKAMPTNWAAVQNNLGIALLVLGEGSDGQIGLQLLKEAIAAFHLALEVRRRDVMELSWAMTQTNLGAGLRLLGERSKGQRALDLLRESAAAHRIAIEVFDEMGSNGFSASANAALVQTDAAMAKWSANANRGDR